MTAPVISVAVPGPAELAAAAAAWTAERITGAVAARRACYLALAGGETPRGCYERLAGPPYRFGTTSRSSRRPWQVSTGVSTTA